MPVPLHVHWHSGCKDAVTRANISVASISSRRNLTVRASARVSQSATVSGVAIEATSRAASYPSCPAPSAVEICGSCAARRASVRLAFTVDQLMPSLSRTYCVSVA
jgi:hypothetical protein